MSGAGRCGIVVGAAAAVALGLACASAGPVATPAHPAPAAPNANPWAAAARDVLAPHCGSCHRRDLPTKVPRALAVFDLLDEPWYGRLTAEQLGGVLLRVRGTKGILPEDAAVVERFVRCARDGECDVSASPDSAGRTGGGA